MINDVLNKIKYFQIKDKVDTIKLENDLTNLKNMLSSFDDKIIEIDKEKKLIYKLGEKIVNCFEKKDKGLLNNVYTRKYRKLNSYDIIETFSKLYVTKLGSDVSDDIDYIKSLEMINYSHEIESRADSIEYDSENIDLDMGKYLINSKLEQLLVGPKINNEKNNSFYVIIFGILKKDGEKNTLIYNYIKYSDIFSELFYTYITYQQNSLRRDGNYNTGTNYYFLSDLSHRDIKKTIDLDLYKSYGNYLTIIDIMKYYSRGNVYTDTLQALANILIKLYENNHRYLEEILIERHGKLDIEAQDIKYSVLHNTLSKFVFVVSNLELFKNEIKKLGIVDVNEGPQKFRGGSNFLGHSISMFDKDFRNSMYRHNIRYSSMGYNHIAKVFFSYQNINIKLGYTRWYSTMRKLSNESEKLQQTNQKEFFVSKLLNQLVELHKDEMPSNRETQLAIENLLFEQFNIYLEDNKKSEDLLGYTWKVSSKTFKDYINKIRLELEIAYGNLKKNDQSNSYTKNENLLESVKIISKIETNWLVNLSLVTVCEIYTNEGIIDEDDIFKNNEIELLMRLGKKTISKYLYNSKKQYMNQVNTTSLSYTEWKEIWISNNSKLNDMILEDKFIVILGGCILGILIDENIIEQKIETRKLNKTIRKTRYCSIVNKDLLNIKHKSPIVFPPTKLPMIIKPNNYDVNKYGGYLLNDDKYKHDLFIDKKGFQDKSELKTQNILYEMVNSISSVEFKINTDVLDYLLMNGEKLGLLRDVTMPHQYSNIVKPSKIQQRKISSHNSLNILQENILGIANFYRKFPIIYFPVRLDFRGRSYCEASYFNYQSSELSKALVAFAKPGIIHRFGSEESISYMKAYGAHCFGGVVSKSSTANKAVWVDKNVDNIINYDNGILLKKAKDKLLFLAFCIEYKRYNEFLNDVKQIKFETYLPIQLDATCNGFQHMALLSDEESLFKQLNLVQNKDNMPSDFYNFILHKLKTDLMNKKDDTSLTQQERDSYQRINNFIWDRSHVKKAIMTIPYNVSVLSMIKYIKDSLTMVDLKDKNNTWYSTEDNNLKNCISSRDIRLLADKLHSITTRDFIKIKRLSSYLQSIASACCLLSIPIVWTLPSGLVVKQSYLETESTSIKPFLYSKIKLNLIVNTNILDKQKQIRALMPNLIHSLDATSLALLYESFRSEYHLPQFYSVHDCFGTTADKVAKLKVILASIYTYIYTNDPYIISFDKCIMDNIENNYPKEFNREKRMISLANGKNYSIHDIDWVLNKKHVDNKTIRKISSQYILI